MSGDVVRLEGLEIDAGIGVYPHEQGVLQRLVIDLAITVDVREAAESGDLSKTVDYDRAAAIAREVARSGHHRLIETVAEVLAKRLLSELPLRARAVWVRVAKPTAVSDAKTVAVEIRRER